MSLKERRQKLNEREDKVERLIKAEKADAKHIHDEIKEEREERDQYEKSRKRLKKELEDEIAADEKGKGLKDEDWERWAENRRDELADLIDASEARLDRLVERAAKSEKTLAELLDRDASLDKRIEKVQAKLKRMQEDKKGQLTKDFHMAEFDCRNGTPVPSYMEDELRALCTQHLQPLRNSGGSVHINSGYRTAAYNAAIGGASQSYHVYDVRKTAPAADHVQAGRSAPNVQQWHDSHNPPDGMGYYSGFTHIDDRGYRSRWYGAS